MLVASSFSDPLALSGSFHLTLGYWPFREPCACTTFQRLGAPHTACQRCAGPRNFQWPCSGSHSVFRVAREVVNQACLGQDDAVSKTAEKIASLQQGGSISVYYHFYCCDVKRMLEPFLLLMKGNQFGLLC